MPMIVRLAFAAVVALTAACATPRPMAAVRAPQMLAQQSCQTGTHLRWNGPCLQAVRIITRQDIARTGATTTANAVRHLTPSFR